MEDFEFMKEDSSMSDKDYFRQILADTEKLSVHLRWNFDEQQADPFHHHFTSMEFVRRLKRLVDRIEELESENENLHIENDTLCKRVQNEL